MSSHQGDLQEAPRRRTRSGRPGRLGWLLPLMVGLLVTAVAFGVATQVPAKYRATAYTVVVPADRADLDQAATLFDSLSRGQIVATASTLINQTPVTAASEGQVTAGDVTPSAVVQVSVTTSDPATAQAALTQVLADSTPIVNANIKPYLLRTLTDTAQPAERVGLGTGSWLAISLVAGLVAAALAGYVMALARRSQS